MKNTLTEENTNTHEMTQPNYSLKTKINLIKKDFKESPKRKLNFSDDIPLSAAQKAKLSINYVFLSIWALIILTPFISIIVASFNGAHPSLIYFTQFTFTGENYSKLINDTSFGFWFMNSIYISISTMIITLLAVSLTGYAYSRFRFKGKHISIMTILLVQMIPSSASLVAFIVIHEMISNTIAIPAWMILVFIYSGTNTTANTFILKGYLDGISKEIDDSGKIDGCGNVKLYFKIIMPLACPMLAVIAIGSFIGPFNDVLLPSLLLTADTQRTLPVGLQSLLQADALTGLPRQPLYAAGSVITAIPILTIFLISQRYMVSGLSAGGVKG